MAPFYTEVEMDPTGGTNYTVSGTEQLLSVPYALHSETSSSLVSGSGGGGGAGYIFQQEIPIDVAGNGGSIYFGGATTDDTGNYALISYVRRTGSNWHLNVAKLKKDPLTGQFFLENIVNSIGIFVNTGAPSFQGVAYLNGYYYVAYAGYNPEEVRIYRVDPNNLSSAFLMNIIVGSISAGDNDLGKTMYTDGIFLYVFNYFDGSSGSYV